MEARVAAEETARQKAEKEKQDLEARAAEYQKSHQDAEAKLETTRKTLAAEKEARQKAEKEKQDLEARAAESQRKHIEAMTEKYTQTEEKQRQERETQTEDKRREAEAKLERELETTRKTLAEKENEKRELEDKAAEYQRSHQEAEAKLETTRNTLAAEEAARQKAENELATKAAEYKEAEAKLEERLVEEKNERESFQQQVQEADKAIEQHLQERKQLQDRERMLTTENALLETKNRQLKATARGIYRTNDRQLKATASGIYRQQLRQERDELQRKLEANRATLETLATAKRELENKVQESDASLARVRKEAHDCNERLSAAQQREVTPTPTMKESLDPPHWGTLTPEQQEFFTMQNWRIDRLTINANGRNRLIGRLNYILGHWSQEDAGILEKDIDNHESAPHRGRTEQKEEKRQSPSPSLSPSLSPSTARFARNLRMSNAAHENMHQLKELEFTPIFSNTQQQADYNATKSRIDILPINADAKHRLVRRLNYVTENFDEKLESKLTTDIEQYESQARKPNIFRERFFYSSSLSSTPELAEVASASLIGRRASTVSDSKRRGDWQGNFSGADYLRRLAIQYSTLV